MIRIEIGRLNVRKVVVVHAGHNPPRCGVVELAVTEIGSGLTAVGGDMIVKATSPGLDVTIRRVVDAKGNTASFQGPPVWASSDEAIATVTPTEDGMGASVSIVGPVGNAQVSVRLDADTSDEGVKEIIGTVDIEVVAGEASVVELDAVEKAAEPV